MKSVGSAVTLEAADYERVFAVLERASAGTSLESFPEHLLDAISDVFGVRHVSYFNGSSIATAFADSQPFAVSERTRRGLREYVEHWGSSDVFAGHEGRTLLHNNGVVSLDHLRRPSYASRRYIEQFLGRWQLECCAAFTFRPGPLKTVIVGVFDTDASALGPRDLVALQMLARHLPVVARSLATQETQASPALTMRDRELVDLVASGLTNAEIGRRLCLAEDTVKKYVSRLLRRADCATRTELAVRAAGWRPAAPAI